MKLDREALWWKYSNAGVMISIRGFHALLDDIERQMGEPLKRIANNLRKAGATLPAPDPKGTPESGIVSGLCVALVLVEEELNAAPSESSADELEPIARPSPMLCEKHGGYGFVSDCTECNEAPSESSATGQDKHETKATTEAGPPLDAPARSAEHSCSCGYPRLDCLGNRRDCPLACRSAEPQEREMTLHDENCEISSLVDSRFRVCRCRERQLERELSQAREQIAKLMLSLDCASKAAGIEKTHAERAEQQLSEKAVPDGWQAVPKEPTEKMIEAGIGPFLAAHDSTFIKNEPCKPIYRAMLAAAPKVTP